MQQTLYLVRHAHALPAASDDERAVSPKGERQLARLSEGLRRFEPSFPHAIWSSPLLRARQTATLLKQGLELEAPIEIQANLAPFDAPRPIADQVNAIDRSLMIVGHEPNLSKLSSLFLGDTGNDRVVFKKASILCLTRLTAGRQSTPWQIEWHVNHLLFNY
ncbi:MAG: hypothetical protein CBD18_00260 [Opitutales bacterium TMED158]|nr:MAG: hypothetical protein CBD18_00260 [Opitutales bacterium TMED158]